MPLLPNSLNDWSTDAYNRTIKNELQSLEQGILPLEKGLNEGGEVDDSDITVTVFESSDTEHQIQTKVTVFFSEMSGACSCAGDGPHAMHAHCTMLVKIDKSTAEASFKVVYD